MFSKGRRASQRRKAGKKISAWGSAILQHTAKGDECPAMSPRRQAAEAAPCLDDRCFHSHPTGCTQCPRCHSTLRRPRGVTKKKKKKKKLDWQDVKRSQLFFLFNAINLRRRRQVLARGPQRSLLAISFLAAALGLGL